MSKHFKLGNNNNQVSIPSINNRNNPNIISMEALASMNPNGLANLLSSNNIQHQLIIQFSNNNNKNPMQQQQHSLNSSLVNGMNNGGGGGGVGLSAAQLIAIISAQAAANSATAGNPGSMATAVAI